MDNNGKINIGIDLGTTNSAVAVVENGVTVIKKSSTLKDTTPSIVSINRKKVIRVGDIAANELAAELLRVTKTWDDGSMSSDIFMEFKRALGTSRQYHCKNLDINYSPEQLSAEVVKAMLSIVALGGHQEKKTVRAAVISVPAKFDATQKNATVEAAKMAGLEYCELIQEPIAAAITYGVDTGENKGYWLVYDFGGGTFDAALLRVDNGVQQIVDTEGDGYLGGKDIDYALVDEIFLPYLKKRFKISKILASEQKRGMLRNAMKLYAEDAKIQLSMKPKAEILSNLGELGCDDEGKELELDLEITESQAEPVMKPFFERTIVLCNDLLQRNGVTSKQLTKLILIGGSTYSPLLREMLRKEVTPNVDTSIDPMTAVAKGAAIYASTRDIPNDLRNDTENDNVEMKICYDSMSASKSIWAAIKLIPKKGQPIDFYVEVTRDDGAWSSGKMPYNKDGVAFELNLVEHALNRFTIIITDKTGRFRKVSKGAMTILQGAQVTAIPLPYHIGFGVWDEKRKRAAFMPFKGLEKNALLPAVGVAYDRKTTMKIMPGREDTFMRIPVYQAPACRPKSPAYLYEHVADVVITGKDVKREIPAKSLVEITVHADNSEQMCFTVYIPQQDVTVEKKLDASMRVSDQDNVAFYEEYSKVAEKTLDLLAKEQADVSDLRRELRQIERKFKEKNLDKKAFIATFKAYLRDLYAFECETELSRLMVNINSELLKLSLSGVIKCDKHGNEVIDMLMELAKQAWNSGNVFAAEKVLDEIKTKVGDLTFEKRAKENMKWYDANFDVVKWKDKEYARECLNGMMDMLKSNPTKEALSDAYWYLISLLEGEIVEANGLLG